MSFGHSNREYKEMATSFHQQNVYARLLKYTGQTKSATIVLWTKTDQEPELKQIKRRKRSWLRHDDSTAKQALQRGRPMKFGLPVHYRNEHFSRFVFQIFYRCQQKPFSNNAPAQFATISLLIREQCLPPRTFDSLTLDTAL